MDGGEIIPTDKEFKEIIEGLLEENKSLKQDVQGLQNKLKAKEAKLAEVKAELKNLKSSSSDGSELLRAKESKIEQLEKQKNELSKGVEELKGKIQSLESENKKLLSEKNNLTNEKNNLIKQNTESENKLRAARQSQEPRYAIIWGHIWESLAVLLDVIVICLFVFCSLKIITAATIALAVFLSLANILILAMRILYCISEFTEARFNANTLLPTNIFGTACLVAVFMLMILVFGAGM